MTDLAAVREFLVRHHVVTLATVDSEGPWAASVFYAAEGWILYFLSSPRSRHARALERDPRVAGAIDGERDDWRRITGLQLAGRGRPVPAEGLAAAREVYFRRFPFVEELYDPVAGGFVIGGNPVDARFYEIQIDRIYAVDNARAFGRRRGWELFSIPER